MTWHWHWSCGGGRAGDFQGSFAEGTSSPHSSEQSCPFPCWRASATAPGGGRLERGRQPEAVGRAEDGFVLHSSLVTCHMRLSLPVLAPRDRLWLLVPVPGCRRLLQTAASRGGGGGGVPRKSRENLVSLSWLAGPKQCVLYPHRTTS